MSETQLARSSSQERIQILDVLRGLAIGGILIGNMQWFSGYGFMPSALAEQSPLTDQITHFLVHFFIEGKFYSIFHFCSVSDSRCKSAEQKNAATRKHQFSNGVCSGCC
jgi:uncharacterized membrane protein YeiB